MSPSTNNAGSLTNVPSATILDPLHELFTTTITSQNKAEGEVQTIDKELQNAFSSLNDHSINNGGVMSNEKIMALFNTPQTSVATLSGMNIRTTSNQPLNRMYRNRNNLMRWQLTLLFV
jgi:hypothetical protein